MQIVHFSSAVALFTFVFPQIHVRLRRRVWLDRRRINSSEQMEREKSIEERETLYGYAKGLSKRIG